MLSLALSRPPRARRGRLSRLRAALVGLAAIAACRAPAWAECRSASLPLSFSGQVFEVPVRSGRTLMHFVLDTGAVRSVIDRETAQRLHVASDPHHLSAIIGVGGRGAAVPDVVLPQVELGSEMLGELRLAVGNLRASTSGRTRHDGVLGADVLSRYDVEIDFPARRLVLHDPGCHAGGPPWRAQGQILATGADDGLIFAPVAIDGRSFRGLVDSGAAATTLSHAAAELTGLSASDLARDGTTVGQGAAGPRVTASLHRFDRLAVGRDAFAHPVLAIVPRLPVGDLLLGLDYLHKRRLWIAAAPNRILWSAPGP
ncbi:MAG TPA: retroviral-like aspartic protease family protein [Lichenihabitans sp.]|jgi:predicted aspartyl protease|nr:retroviral-like aspartic protease family protein [Lichenihabitans sp.]